MLLAFLGLSISNERIRNEQELTSRALAEAEAAKAEAELSATQASKKSAQLSEVLDFFRTKILLAVGPAAHIHGQGRDVTLRSVIEAALPELEAKFSNEPTIEAERRSTLAKSLLSLNEPVQAEEQARRAFDLYREHVGNDHSDTLQSMQYLAAASRQLGRLEDALALCNEVVDRQQVIFDHDHPRMLSAQDELARIYTDLGRVQDVVDILTEVLETRLNSLDEHDRMIQHSMGNLAVAYTNLGAFDKGRELHEKLVRIRSESLGRNPMST